LNTDQATRFRWVDCQLDALQKCRTPAALKTALDSLPTTLYKTYDRILCNIREDDRPSAIRVLQWLAFSVRPITLPEVVEVLATNPHAAGGRYFNPDERLLDPRDILTICSNLVTISEPVECKVVDIIDRYFLPRRTQAEVRLAHFSVREYLISDHFPGGGTSLFYFNQNMAHTFIAKTCLTYLLQFDEPGDTDSWGIHQDFPLSAYAAEHWIHHARLANYDSDTLQGLIMALLSSKDAMWANWLWLHDPDMTFKIDSVPSGGPLYYTSLLGLGVPSQKLLEMGADVNAYGGMYGTALQAATSYHHAEVVQLLLEKGADVNIQGGRAGTALQAASSNGDVKIVQLLLAKGADVNMQGGRSGTALQAASSKGHANIVQLLLERGADVNMQGRTGLTALHAASANGHANVVPLLLKTGANANSAGWAYGTALQDASSNGHAEIVRLLLENGADLDAQGGLYGTALQAASSNNHTDIVQILLSNGADMNVQGVTRCTALQEASSKGHVDMVRLLLENGADPNAQGGWRATALQEASSGGHIEIVQLLLDRGADMNTVGEFGGALEVALAGGH
jgi:ankyrin repeat protein